MLYLDALVDAPTIGVTLTTRDPATEAEVYRLASAAVWKRLRRAHGPVEYFGLVEFTTGRAARSGGERRLHGHYLVKGLAGADVLDVGELVRETWHESTRSRGRAAWVVDVAELRAPGAAIGYVGLHHRKPQQAPPAGWRGMAERPSQGYFHRPVAALREQARAELQVEAIAWAHGLPAELAALEVEFRRAQWAEHRARVIRVHEPTPAHAIVEPLQELGL